MLLLELIGMAIANATEAERALIEATQNLAGWTQQLVYASYFGGASVAGVAFYIWFRQHKVTEQLNREGRMRNFEKELDVWQ